MVLKWAQSPAGEREPGNLILRVPLAGPLVQRIQLGFFARTLGTLLECGVPIVAALRITADTLGNPQYREAVAGLAAIVRDGESSAGPLRATPSSPAACPASWPWANTAAPCPRPSAMRRTNSTATPTAR
jgi:type II secretory pathway component PulF